MKNLFCCVTVLLLLGLVFTSGVEVDDEEFSGSSNRAKQTNTGSQITLEHSIDNGKNFGYRGKITYFSAYANELDSDETQISQAKLNEQDLLNLKNLIQHGGYYQFRVPFSTKSFSVASVKACALVASNFQDQITVHFGPQGASIARVDYSTVYGCDANTDAYVQQVDQLIKSSSNVNWKTSLRFVHAIEEFGPKMQPLVEQQKEQQEQQQQQQGSWLTRYWYIILPLFLMMLMNAVAGVQAPEGQGQGQGGQRAPAQRAPTARRT